MKNFPVWFVLLLLVAFIVAISFAFLSQRKVHDVPLKERRKRLLIMAGVTFSLLLIITVVSSVLGIALWQNLLTNAGFLLLLLLNVGTFFYAFFRKEKKQDTAKEAVKEPESQRPV